MAEHHYDKVFRSLGIKARKGEEEAAGTESLGDKPNMTVRWAPVMDTSLDEAQAHEGVTTMPIFPLGQTYLPYSAPALLIFEPRYRAMYDDILLSGARRFMVCNVHAQTGRLAEVGAVFY